MKTTANKQIGALLLASAVLAVVANSVHPQRIPWLQDWSRQVEAKAAEQKVRVIPLPVALEKFRDRKAAFLDARPAEDFKRGHIPGAVSVPLESIDEQYAIIVKLIDSGKELVVYCKNRECDDALLLATELNAMDRTNIILFIDGFESWEKYGGEVER